MPINEVFAIVQTVASNVTVAAKSIKTVASSLEELKSSCDIRWFQSTKSKLNEFRTKLGDAQGRISSLEQEISNLENTVASLKQKINTEFPELKRLVISYSEIRKDVAIAGAISNKAGEIIKIRPDIASIYIFSLTVPTRGEHTRIVSNFEVLPSIDTEVVGVIREKLTRIGILIRDLERMSTPQRNNQNLDPNRAAEIFQEIFENYASIETRLSELLNRRILKDFDPVS